MKKQTFEKGDRVFDIRFGWGTVVDDNSGQIYAVGVQFDKDDSQEVIFYTGDGKRNLGEEFPLLSFMEYTLQGFTQERPINYDDYVGKWGKFWAVIKDVGIQNTVIGHLSDYNENDIEGFPFACEETGGYYTNFEPLTEEQIKVLGL